MGAPEPWAGILPWCQGPGVALAVSALRPPVVYGGGGDPFAVRRGPNLAVRWESHALVGQKGLPLFRECRSTGLLV